MRIFSRALRLAVYLLIALTSCFPLLKVTASSIEEEQTQQIAPASHVYVGQFESGLSYAVIPFSCVRGGVWISLTSPSSQDKENAMLSLLTQHAFFYGTKDNDRQEIARRLNSLEMDSDPSSLVRFDDFERSLHFCLTINEPAAVLELLALINQLAFSPILQDEEIELARSHLLQSMEDILSPEQKQVLQALKTTEVRDFYLQWFRPEMMELKIVGCDAHLQIIHDLPQVFGKCIKSECYPQSSL